MATRAAELMQEGCRKAKRMPPPSLPVSAALCVCVCVRACVSALLVEMQCVCVCVCTHTTLVYIMSDILS